MYVFRRFLIWPLIIGLCPFEIIIRKNSLLLLLLDPLKDFHEIKYGNSYLYLDRLKDFPEVKYVN